MRYELIIFDCDGVLVDSEPISNQIFAACFQEIGIPISYEIAVRDYVGLSLKSSFEHIEKTYGKRIPADFEDNMQDQTKAAFLRELQPVPGVREAIANIKDAGAKVCVASSGEIDKMEVSLGVTGLWHAFAPDIFSATEVERGKPHPDLFLHAARRMAVAPERCAVIEDSLYGARAAKAAGMDAYGYVGGEDAKPLADEGAREFRDMAMLRAMLS
jgi:HAD superfamily hydrolase (TIGR01509 family)